MLMCEGRGGVACVADILVESEDRKEPGSKERDCRFVTLVSTVRAERRVSMSNLRFIPASLTSI